MRVRWTPAGWLARRTHPRLAVIVLLGGTGTALGVVLWLAGVGPEGVGRPLAVLGFLVLLFGTSGYVASVAFERGFD